MTLPLLLALSMSTSALPASSAAAGEGITLSRSIEGRKASLLEGVELSATYEPSASPPLQLMDGARFALADAPMALDQGGGVDSSTSSILALLLGLIVGFGTGHLVAHDQNGFILFLVVDLALIAAIVVFDALLIPYVGLVGSLGLLVSHVIQGISAYGEASGQKLIELTRQREVRLASAGTGLQAPITSTRAFAFSF